MSQDGDSDSIIRRALTLLTSTPIVRLRNLKMYCPARPIGYWPYATDARIRAQNVGNVEADEEEGCMQSDDTESSQNSSDRPFIVPDNFDDDGWARATILTVLYNVHFSYCTLPKVRLLNLEIYLPARPIKFLSSWGDSNEVKLRESRFAKFWELRMQTTITVVLFWTFQVIWLTISP